MKDLDRANIVFEKSISESAGFIELAIEQQKNGCDTTALIQRAIEALQRFSNDDDLIDAMYDEDMQQ